MSNKEDLPSINDYLEDSELPSYKDFIEEEKELPSVEEYKTHIEEETIEDANGNTFAEVIDVIKAPEWQELVKLVNDVRKDIPEIPEIKSYDEEIGEISEKIAEIQENFSQYDLKSDKHLYGFTIQLGYKSTGFALGEKLDKEIIFRAGMTFKLGDKSHTSSVK